MANLTSSFTNLDEVFTNIMEYVKLQDNFRSRLATYQPTGEHDDTTKFLQKTLMYLPRDGRMNLMKYVFQCISDEQLCELAGCIDHGFLRPLAAAGHRAVPFHSGSDGPDSGCMLREQCFARHGNMCVVTGAYDNSQDPIPPGKLTTSLEAVRILPGTLGCFSNDAERQQTCAMWNSIYRYFLRLQSELHFGHEDINGIRNVVMLESLLGDEFELFMFTLEPTGLAHHQYHMKITAGFNPAHEWFLPEHRTITLTSYDDRYPLPNPVLFDVHAAISNILETTGRGILVSETIDEYRLTMVVKELVRHTLRVFLSVSGVLCRWRLFWIERTETMDQDHVKQVQNGINCYIIT